LVLVFPEGARGTEKLYSQRHSLVDFGTGFMRLALQTNTPIVPFAFLGGGEAIPTVFNAYKIARLVGMPYIPVTPWLVPLPLPTRLDLVIDEPMRFSGDGTEEDDVIEGYVAEVKGKIAQLIDRGRRLRGELPKAA
jgi:1-acyl-sn-glycerol-3-phosphate acyltransferase